MELVLLQTIFDPNVQDGKKKLSSGVITEYNHLWCVSQLALSLLVRAHVQCLCDNRTVLFTIAKNLGATKMPFRRWMDN